MPKCLQILKVCQTALEKHPYAFDLTGEFEQRWTKDTQFDSGFALRPNPPNRTGRQYRSAGGVSGEDEPQWPRSGTVSDGSVVWSPELMSYDGLRLRITTVDWTAPSGIAAGDQVETDHPAVQEARVWVSGGTPGRKYTIKGVVHTVQGEDFEVRLEMTIEK